MTLRGLLASAIRALRDAEVPFMVSGSLAASYYGEPRATRDIDIVIDPTPGQLTRLVELLDDAGFYVDPEAARQALADRAQFNAISDGAKVDFMVRRDRPFSVAEFARRRPTELLGTPGFVVSAEDLVIVKLEWATESDSDRQLRDVEGILAISGPALDRGYIESWVGQLGLERAWRRVSEAWPPTSETS